MRWCRAVGSVPALGALSGMPHTPVRLSGADPCFTGSWSGSGADHMLDHNWKIKYPGVAYRLGTWFGSRRPGFGPQHSESPEALGTHGTTAVFPSPVTGQKSALTTCLTTIENFISGISAVGSAGGLGPSGREFESPISDQKPLESHDFKGFSLYIAC